MIILQGNSLPVLRTQLEIARELAKSHIGFVVVPVKSAEELTTFCQMQKLRLEEIADYAEAAEKERCE